MKKTLLAAISIVLITGCAAPATHPVVLRGDRQHHECEYSDGMRCDLNVIKQRVTADRYQIRRY